MPEFIHFPNFCEVTYPIGQYYGETSKFVEEAANMIHKTFPEGELILVVRGHSGSILAGGIALILSSLDRYVKISISRKAESCHGHNLEGLPSLTESRIIVVDDFVASGRTIGKILGDLKSRYDNSKKFDMLCVANAWDKSMIYGKNINEYYTIYGPLLKNFKLVLCNSPQLRDLNYME